MTFKKYIEFKYKGKGRRHFGYYDMDYNLWDVVNGRVNKNEEWELKVLRETDNRKEWEGWERKMYA